jgi:Family of unknown function (DUF6300)
MDIRGTADVHECPRCGGQGLLSAQVPHEVAGLDGRITQGHVIVVLCSSCDAADLCGGPLVTFFHVHGQVTAETLQEAAALIQQWAEGITIPPVDMAMLDQEYQAWRHGDL